MEDNAIISFQQGNLVEICTKHLDTLDVVGPENKKVEAAIKIKLKCCISPSLKYIFKKSHQY